jgi:hypothetical protein
MNGQNPDFFVGIISSSDAGTYNIHVEPFGSQVKGIMQGIPLMSVFASTLGFRECPQYGIGVNVLCYPINTERCYIIGIIPEADMGNIKFYSRVALKTADGNFDSQNTVGYGKDYPKLITHNQNRPTDIVEGEYALHNDFGVLLGLFQQMASLKGSELAQIQCYAMDDLVRIVSHNFQHWTALGEFNIWHDGKAIMAEFGATHLSAESMGSPAVTSSEGKPTFSEDGGTPTPDDSVDYYKIDGDERTKAISRMKIFLGRLGDFMHLFLVRPDEDAIRTLSGAMTGNFDKGLLDIHVATDGRFTLRSVSSIAIEKTNWIMVPERVRSPEDPKGDDAEELTYPDKDPFVFDNTYKYQGNPGAYFLQMRDCVAYLQDLYSYKNFITHEKDFKLSKSTDNQETSLEGIDQVDEKTKVNFKDYVLRKSGLYFMDNGGVLVVDAWGSAIVMEGGDINLQAAKDVINQPMRNYIVKAGQFGSLCSKKDFDISSTEEGFRLKTAKVQHFYSVDQGILLQSGAKNKTAPSPEDKAYTEFGGIILDAKDSGVYTYGKDIFDRSTERSLYKSNELNIQADDKIYVSSEKDLYLLSGGTVHAEAVDSMRLVSKGTAMLGGTSDTLIGQKGKIVGLIPHPKSLPAILDGVLDCDSLAVMKDAFPKEKFQEKMQPFDKDEVFDKIKFRFLASDVYNLSEKEDYIPMTIAQQNDQTFGFLNLKEWKEKEVEGTLPYPGKDKFESFYVTAELKNLQNKGNDLESKGSDNLTPDGTTLSVASLNTYKILEK